MSKPVVWFEILGKDAGKLQEFYGGLFGWKFQQMPEMEYGMVEHSDGIGGGVGKAPEGPGWVTVYVASDDVEADLAKANAAGATTLMPPMGIPSGGTIAVFADPEGHPVGLVKEGEQAQAQS